MGISGSMEANCVSLEMAEKLEKAGFPQNSFFSWLAFPIIEGEGIDSQWIDEEYILKPIMATSSNLGISAPTAQEIADQLPDYALVKSKTDGKYRTVEGDRMLPKLPPADSIAEALAQVWLELHKGV